MQQKVFVNELGNEITLSISEKDIDGVEGVLIEITGPTSDTEIHITKSEARTFFEELKSFLAQERS